MYYRPRPICDESLCTGIHITLLFITDIVDSGAEVMQSASVSLLHYFSAVYIILRVIRSCSILCYAFVLIETPKLGSAGALPLETMKVVDTLKQTSYAFVLPR